MAISDELNTEDWSNEMNEMNVEIGTDGTNESDETNELGESSELTNIAASEVGCKASSTAGFLANTTGLATVGGILEVIPAAIAAVPVPPLMMGTALGTAATMVSMSPKRSALQRYQQDLRRHRIQSSIPHKWFIPLTHVHRLVRRYVLAILQEESLVQTEITSWSSRIIKEAPKVLTILTQVQQGRRIIDFMNEGIRDDDLPLQIVPAHDNVSIALVTRHNKPIRALESLDEITIDRLYERQFPVPNPVFRRGEHYSLNELHTLPFIRVETEEVHEAKYAGGFGDVHREYIHPDHHTFKVLSRNNGLAVAVKIVYMKEDYEIERKVYRDLGQTRHPHLLELLFTFCQDHLRHVVFPWADGSLRDYWRQYPTPGQDSDNIHWSLEQMVGTASALAFIHEFKDAKLGTTLYGRHGAIRARSILRFRETNVLKIGSLGLARLHSTDPPVDPATVVELPTYSPPDRERRLLVSRKWDTFGLGCLYLEFVTYLVLGNAAIQQFSRHREGTNRDTPELISDNSYTEDCESVRPSVTLWVEQLKQ
ncbi:kinase-like domain-containing protein [Aspergillus multicolor]|uniref:kinase-like domain-containing protein n=1 Tax=Aspergillus multicolor TaxID=41759 RepID=UPI003CCC9416